MSLIAVVALKTGEIGMWGDSIETRYSPQNPFFGTTSHGEAVQPRTTRDGNIEDYVETACKVGLFGENVICGFVSDDVNFAISILDILSERLKNLQSLSELQQVSEIARISISGTSGHAASATFLIIGVFSTTPTFCKIDFIRDVSGSCRLTLAQKEIKKGEEWFDYFGSGRELLAEDDRDAIGSFVHQYYADQSLRSLFAPAIAHVLSSQVRKKQRNEAPGVGGVFLGYFLSENAVLQTTDTMHIFAVDGILKIACKTLYRDRFFLFKDFISGGLKIFLPLDLVIRLRRGEQFNLQLDALKAVNMFQASSCLVDIRTQNEPDSFGIRIVENPGGEALRGMASLPNFDSRIEPNSKATLRFLNGEMFSVSPDR